jgi:hypothetical protein
MMMLLEAMRSLLLSGFQSSTWCSPSALEQKSRRFGNVVLDLSFCSFQILKPWMQAAAALLNYGDHVSA